MIFKEINKEDLENSKMVSKKNSEQKDYVNLYSAYRNLFTQYVIKKLNLQEYDNRIEKSELNFKANSEQDMDSYQYFSSNVLKYFYVRNNIFINNLNEEEKEFLAEKIKKDDIYLDENEEDFINNTYKKVICRQQIEDDKPTVAFYGMPTVKFMAPNDSVVIGFRYDEFAKQGLDDNSWVELHNKQMKYLITTIKEIKETSKKNMSNDVAIIKYDKYSTIPRVKK